MAICKVRICSEYLGTIYVKISHPAILMFNVNMSPALVAIAQIYTGRPNDILPAITQLEASEHEPGNLEDVGLDFLETSARLGDSASMAYLAEAFDTGLNLGSDRDQSYSQVLRNTFLRSRQTLEFQPLFPLSKRPSIM